MRAHWDACEEKSVEFKEAVLRVQPRAYSRCLCTKLMDDTIIREYHGPCHGRYHSLDRTVRYSGCGKVLKVKRQKKLSVKASIEKIYL